MYACFFITLLGLWAAVTSATPVACQPFTDTFEELDSNPLLPQFNNVGVYHGITYRAFSERNPLTSITTSVQPQSGDKIAGFSITTDLLRLGAITLRPFGYLEVSATTRSFDLISLYFGCGINTRTPAVGRAQACDIFILGYDENGIQGPVTKASFYPNTFSSSPMQLVKLPSTFQKMSKIVLGIDDAAVSKSQSVIYVDDVKHCNRAKA